jgi:hypothetical protein
MMTRGVRLLGLSVVVFALSVLPALASLALPSGVRIVRLSVAQGDVQIDRNTGDGWEQAINNMPVVGGARIYAAEESKAEIEFEDGSSVRLAGPAQITLVELSSNSSGAPVNVLQVNSGEVYVNARLRRNDDFRLVDADGASFVIKRPSRLRLTVDQQTASLAMMDGEAVGQNSDAKIISGQTYNYILGQPGSAASLNSVPPEPEDGWNQKRESYNDQYAPTGAQFSGSDDPNAAGVADLGYYGNYSDIPGYGVAWQPNNVGPDWDPFDNGAWSYYPGWGWTFVSGYNWGWAPFYYGDWCYIGGRGWWWRPGPVHGPGHGWHPQPLVTGHPGGKWSAPHPPAKAAGHATVAVAGSHLRVGPISETHAAMSATPSATQSATHSTGGSANKPGTAGSRFSGHTGTPAGGPAGQVGVHSNLIRGAVVVGQKGSYSLAGGVTSGRNGYEVHRPDGSAPRSYTYEGSGSATRSYSGPAASIQHSAPSAPSAASAPHMNSGGGSVSHSGSGGGSHGGGGGGGSHGGGGGGGHR